jgi:hypothetical protein
VSIFYLQAAWFLGMCFSSQDRKNGQQKMFECGYKQSPHMTRTMSVIEVKVNRVITVFDYRKDSIFVPSLINASSFFNRVQQVDMAIGIV